MSSNSTARLWTTLCSNSGTKSIEMWQSSSNVRETHITPTNTFDYPPISFSPCLKHALPNPPSPYFLEPTSGHHSNSTPFVLQPDGWIMGPNHELLFWVPPASRHAFYTPWTSLIIPRGVELDLSIMAHGPCWSSCRDA
ncbi:hypothetical protein BDR06DRAFT_110839 [Suillus hirtellus]|nr:hypothetical protein BDR06DRAFT_110839 [Suillus hirtellus]